MADIFNNQPGIVAVLDTDSGDDNPFRVTLDDYPQIGAQSGVIFTELAIQRHGNFQFMHTLKDLVYAYSFGERMGQIRASGMAFAQMCDGTEGLSTVMGYYENNRLDVRADPISIVIGIGNTGRFRGFLVEINVQVARPEARLAQFGLQFQVLPSAKSGKRSSPSTFTGASGSVGAPAAGGMGDGGLGGGMGDGGLLGGGGGGMR